MGFKGTKGNWVFKESEVNEDSIDVWGFCERVANMSYKTSLTNRNLAISLKEKVEANAKLIACAPEMLELLERTLRLQKDHVKSGCNTRFLNIEQIERLIKKATE